MRKTSTSCGYSKRHLRRIVDNIIREETSKLSVERENKEIENKSQSISEDSENEMIDR